MNESDLQTGGIGFETLVDQIRLIDEHARRDTARAVNIDLTLRNWSIGFYIDHYELKGADRSKYGDELYHRLAEGLRALSVKSCDRRQLYRYRDFFQTYPQICGGAVPTIRCVEAASPGICGRNRSVTESGGSDPTIVDSVGTAAQLSVLHALGATCRHRRFAQTSVLRGGMREGRMVGS